MNRAWKASSVAVFLMGLALAAPGAALADQGTLSYSYGAPVTNQGYNYRPLNITASYGGSPVWTMALWVPLAGQSRTGHSYWTAGQICSFKDARYGGTPFEYSVEASYVGGWGLMTMSGLSDTGDFSDAGGQQPAYYQFSNTCTLASGITAVTTVRIDAPVMNGNDYQTTIDGTCVVTNTSGATYDLWFCGYAGTASLNVSEGGYSGWGMVNPAASLSKPNAHVTDTTDGHQLYKLYDWYGSTATSALSGFYAKAEVKNNAYTAGKNMRPGLTFELRSDGMSFYYPPLIGHLYGSTGVVAGQGVLLSVAEPGAFGSGAVLANGQSATISYQGLISSTPTLIPPIAEAGPDQTVDDLDQNLYETITLDGSASYDADGAIVSYVWQEGSSVIALAATAALSFPVGTHNLTLTVTDNDGLTGGDSVVITVNNIAPRDYYIDFDGGSDARDGLTPGTAWQHCPGDPSAGGMAASSPVHPGDTFIFKGGVTYRGAIECRWAGLAGLPITYDGNTAGDFGTGPAIIDGSEHLGGWVPCQSAGDAGGNPNWQHIYYTYGPPTVTMSGCANLYENDQMCWLAQDPNQPDPFFMDNISHFYQIPPENMTRTSVTDPVHLNQSDPHYWDGAYVIVWVVPNAAVSQLITGFDPATDTITYAETGDPYTDRTEYYSIYNSIHLLDLPGEYYFNDTAEPDGRHKIYLWPPVAGDPNQQDVTASVRTIAFNVLNGNSYITIQGFTVQKFTGAGYGDGVGVLIRDWNKTADNIIVRENLFTHIRHHHASGRGYGAVYAGNAANCLIEGNAIVEMPANMALLAGGDNIIVRDNYVQKTGDQALWFMGATNSQFVGNEVRDCIATHSNGISAYSGCNNVLIAYNRIFDSNISITTEASTNVTVAYNLCVNPTFYAYCDWGGTANLKVYNNTFVRDEDLPGFFIRGDAPFESKNNLAPTYSGNPSGLDASHNYWYKHAEVNGIFANYAGRDYHLKAGSPAINVGLNLGYTLDLDGVPVPQGAAPDVGAYEYAGDLVISAALDANWVYQNTAGTTLDRQHSVLTVTLTHEAVPGESYAATFAENGGPLADFTIQTTANPLVFNVVGGRVGASAASAPASYSLAVTLTGNASHKSATATVQLQLRLLGDIDGDGDVDGDDKAQMNRRLNSLSVAYPDRVFNLTGDLDGLGNPNIDGDDKAVMNRVLNSLSIP